MLKGDKMCQKTWSGRKYAVNWNISKIKSARELTFFFQASSSSLFHFMASDCDWMPGGFEKRWKMTKKWQKNAVILMKIHFKREYLGN